VVFGNWTSETRKWYSETRKWYSETGIRKLGTLIRKLGAVFRSNWKAIFGNWELYSDTIFRKLEPWNWETFEIQPQNADVNFPRSAELFNGDPSWRKVEVKIVFHWPEEVAVLIPHKDKFKLRSYSIYLPEGVAVLILKLQQTIFINVFLRGWQFWSLMRISSTQDPIQYIGQGQGGCSFDPLWK